MSLFGQTIVSKDIEYQAVLHIQQDYYLAVRKDAKELPLVCYVIKQDPKSEENVQSN
jgi:hypothetical protein